MISRRSIMDGRVYYGWVVTVACFLMTASVFSVTYSFGVFFEPLLADFGRSRADTSLLFSAQTLTLYVSGGAFGWVVDRYGTRRLLLLGTALYGTGLFLTTVATTFLQVLLTYGIVAGVGMGIVYVIAYSTIPRWFYRRRGLASGIGSAGVGAGMFLFPPIVALLLASVAWQRAYFLVAFVIVALLLVAASLVADRPDRLGIDPGTEIPPDRRNAIRRVEPAEQLDAIRSAVVTRAFAALFLGGLLVYTPVFLLFVHVVSYATDVGIARSTAVLAVSVIGFSTLPGRLLVGRVADAVGRSRSLAVATFSMGALTILLPAIRHPLLLLGFAVGYGLAYGGTGALIAPVVSDEFGTGNINALFGLVAVGFGVAAVLGPYAGGATYDALGTYAPVFVGCGVAGLLGSACFALAGSTGQSPGDVSANPDRQS